MARRRRIISKSREIRGDFVYDSVLISKFINAIMLDGKRSLASNIVYSALEQAAKKCNMSNDVVAFFDDVVSKVSPDLEVRSRRVGGSTYQVPVEVSRHRARSLALRWLVKYARSAKKTVGSEYGCYGWLANELVEAFHERGASFKKKVDTHKMAEANKAFSHYRW